MLSSACSGAVVTFAASIDSFKQVGLLFVVFGVVFAGIGVVLIVRERRFVAHAARSVGTVIELHKRMITAGSYPEIVLCPVVRFQTAAGQEITFDNASGSLPARFRVGQSVTVYYDPQHPETAHVASGCLQYGISVIFIVLGAGFALFGALFVLIQRFVDRLPK